MNQDVPTAEAPTLKFPEEIRYLAIEGAIGVGKSSLANIIAERSQADLLEEPFSENPFLEKFYADREAWAFQTQLWFLLSRHRQIQDNFVQEDLFRNLLISDYTVDKDRIFALQNLSENEMHMYDTVAEALMRDLIKPDYVVYLQASVSTLLERIHRRDRAMERSIEGNYLRDLVDRYNHHFFHYEDTPVLIVNTDSIDFVHNEADREDLLKAISACPPGLNYYAPRSMGL
ncbi:MAG TPA: deoxynucleoside kinase [Fibrobacteraceae bacterium]|nr:deoxynucleoside kinase [Fibrobacteraceae bacterium]